MSSETEVHKEKLQTTEKLLQDVQAENSEVRLYLLHRLLHLKLHNDWVVRPLQDIKPIVSTSYILILFWIVVLDQAWYKFSIFGTLRKNVNV